MASHDTYRKIRFTSKTHGATAGLIVTDYEATKLPVTTLSRLYPYSEVFKMEHLEVSPPYSTWDEAFHHNFDEGETT